MLTKLKIEATINGIRSYPAIIAQSIRLLLKLSVLITLHGAQYTYLFNCDTPDVHV